VAAAVVLLIAGTVLFLNGRHAKDTSVASTGTKAGQQQAAATTRPDSPAANPGQNLAQVPAQTPDSNNRGGLAKTEPDKKAGENDELNAAQNEEMYHYAKLVEIKQKELKTIEKDEPLLYRQFSTDVDKLDSAYHSLQAQLPRNPNREQILEAMLQNLQLQMGLLNHQLDIIKQINHSKKTEYEKAYKTT
jgi:hypothetical protein